MEAPSWRSLIRASTGRKSPSTERWLFVNAWLCRLWHCMAPRRFLLGDRLVKVYPGIRLFFPVGSCEIMACSIVSSPGRIVRMGTATETEPLDALIRSGARRLTGFRRRAFIAEVARELCDGNPRQAERRFGWGRDTVAKGLHETRQGMRCVTISRARSPPQRGEGSAARRRHPRHRRTPHLCRSGAQVPAAIYQPVGVRGARRLDRQGVSPDGVCPASGRCGTSSIG